MAALLDRIFNTEKMLKPSQKTGEPLPPGSEICSILLKTAWPSIVETFMLTLISLADVKMVSNLGKEAIAAVNLTNQPRFILLAVFNALNVGVTAIVSRKRGQGDQEGANRILRQIILLYAGLAAVLSALAVFYAYPIMKFAGAQPDYIVQGVTYFRIVMGGIIFNVLNLGINAVQRGVGNTKIAMKTNVAANLVNLCFNFLLIEGRFGFPRLEEAGAALATTLGFVVAFSMSLFAVTRKGGFLELKFTESFRLRWSDLKSVCIIGYSAGVEQICMRIGFFVFAKIVTSLGTVAYATHSICQNLNHLSFCFGDGLAVAAGALLGQSIGRKRNDIAALYGHVSQRIGTAMGLGLTAFMAIFGRQLVMLFSTEPEIIALGGKVTYIMALLCPLQAAQVVFSSCLRVAGDVKYTTRVSFICITFVRTISAYIFCIVLDLGVMGAWYSFLLDQSLRYILHGARYRSGKWQNIKVDA